ncbi:MAG TPA: efflux RND transporter periplasmic adaptor subunit [Bryobacteraceae bacterium]
MKRCYWPAALLPLAIGAGCSRDRITAVKADPLAIAPVAKAATADLSRQITLTAEFRPYQEVDVHAKVAGYLKKIYVDVGDRVKQGQLLAVLEIPEMADDFQRAKAATALSDSNVQRAQDELQRAESAHEAAHLSYVRLAEVIKLRPNLVAQQEIDNAAANDRVSEAQVSAAKAAIAAAKNQVSVAQADQQKVQTLNEYARITAPFEGVVTNRYADTGAMIQAGTASQSQAMPVVRISQNDMLRLVLPVPESVVPRIHLNDRVEVRVPTLSRSFQGKIWRFSGKVSTATRTMETEVDVANPGLVLMPGMYAEAVLTLERRPEAIAVPVEAIVNDSLMVVSPDGVIEERKIKTGLETATSVEVLTGVHAGEMVIIGSRSQFHPGQKVQPKLVAGA